MEESGFILMSWHMIATVMAESGDVNGAGREGGLRRWVRDWRMAEARECATGLLDAVSPTSPAGESEHVAARSLIRGSEQSERNG
jgi:hypothetical protein